MKKFLLIDTFNFLHRAYHALPLSLTNSQGEPINAVYGVTSMLISIFDSIKPDYVVAALDDELPTIRAQGFEAYKAQRKPMEEALSSQIPKVVEILDSFGLNKLILPGYEADDIIGTLINKYDSDEMEFVIASNDQDLWQLIKNNVLVLTPKTQGVGDWIGEKEVIARLGFAPVCVPEYKGFKGDVSDNIPGVYGIGEKTAQKLIIEYKTVHNVYENIKDISPESVKTKLITGKESAYKSRDLAVIDKNVPLSTNIQDCAYSKYNYGKVKEVLEKYHFKSLLKRLGYEVSDNISKTRVQKSESIQGQMPLL